MNLVQPPVHSSVHAIGQFEYQLCYLQNKEHSSNKNLKLEIISIKWPERKSSLTYQITP